MTANVTITAEERRFLLNPHCLSADWFTLLAVQTYNLNSSYLRKHTNCTISLQERHFPTPLRHIEKQQFCWNWATLPLQSSSLQSPKFIVDKPTQWLGQRWPTIFDLRAILPNVATFGPLPTKWFRLWNNRFTSFKLNKVHVLPNAECTFSAKSFRLGNLSLLTNFTKLSSISNTVTIVHFY